MQNASWGGAEGRVFLEEGGVGHGRSMISKLSGGFTYGFSAKYKVLRPSPQPGLCPLIPNPRPACAWRTTEGEIKTQKENGLGPTASSARTLSKPIGRASLL